MFEKINRYCYLKIPTSKVIIHSSAKLSEKKFQHQVGLDVEQFWHFVNHFVNLQDVLYHDSHRRRRTIFMTPKQRAQRLEKLEHYLHAQKVECRRDCAKRKVVRAIAYCSSSRQKLSAQKNIQKFATLNKRVQRVMIRLSCFTIDTAWSSFNHLFLIIIFC